MSLLPLRLQTDAMQTMCSNVIKLRAQLIYVFTYNMIVIKKKTYKALID